MKETKRLTIGNFTLDFSYLSGSGGPTIESGGSAFEAIVDLSNFNGRIKISHNEDPGRGRSGGNATRTRGSIAPVPGRRGSFVATNQQDNRYGSTNVPSVEYAPMTTVLHSACARANPRVDGLEAIHNSNPKFVFIPDLDGRLPIHHLARNESLNTIEGQDTIEPFVKILLNEYPESIVFKDKLGRIPFIDAIIRWIDDEHSSMKRDTIVTGQFIRGLHKYNNTLPTSLVLHPMVDLAISTFSYVLNHSFDPSILSEIVSSVSSVSFFVKSILLIEDNDERFRIVNSSLFKRIILEPKVAGLWLIPMIKTKGIFASRVIDYFQLIDKSSVNDFVGYKRKVNPSDIRCFRTKRELLMKEIEKNKYLIPALTLLCEKEKTRVSKIKIIQNLMHHEVSCRFVRCLLVNDIVMLLSLILLFRQVTLSNGISSTLPKLYQYYGNELFHGSKYEIGAIIVICLYFFIRICSQSMSLLSISFRVYSTAFLQNWACLIIAIIMTLTTCGMMLSNDFFLEDQQYLLSITMGMIWLSFILYLRHVSKHVHIFLASIRHMMWNLKWFFVILLCGIVMFGDMMHIYTTNNGFDCNRLTSNFDSIRAKSYLPNETYYADEKYRDLYVDKHPYCSTNLLPSYAAVFGILRSQFNGKFHV